MESSRYWDIRGYKASPDEEKAVVLYDLSEFRMGWYGTQFYLIMDCYKIYFPKTACWYSFSDKVLWDNSSRYFFLVCGIKELFVFDCETRQAAIMETSFEFGKANIANGVVTCSNSLLAQQKKLDELEWSSDRVVLTDRPDVQYRVTSAYKTDVTYNAIGFPVRVVLTAPNGRNRLDYGISTQSSTLKNRALVTLITDAYVLAIPYEAYGWGRYAVWEEDSCLVVLPVYRYDEIVSLIIDIVHGKQAILNTGYEYLYEEPNPDIRLFQDYIEMFNEKYSFSSLNWKPLEKEISSLKPSSSSFLPDLFARARSWCKTMMKS